MNFSYYFWRAKQDSPKSGLKLESATPTSRAAEKADTLHHDARSGKSLERKDYRANIDKAEVHRNSLKNDNWRNTKETEKPREQPRQEPETWRKPVEEPKPEVPGQRFGKVASALELAQAFSRSVSDAKLDSRIGNQRSQPGRTQVPFSRLTDAREFYSGQAKRQINGYWTFTIAVLVDELLFLQKNLLSSLWWFTSNLLLVLSSVSVVLEKFYCQLSWNVFKRQRLWSSCLHERNNCYSLSSSNSQIVVVVAVVVNP